MPFLGGAPPPKKNPESVPLFKVSKSMYIQCDCCLSSKFFFNIETLLSFIFGCCITRFPYLHYVAFATIKGQNNKIVNVLSCIMSIIIIHLLLLVDLI